MIKPLSWPICFALTIGIFSLSHQAQSDGSHDQWLQERYFEATSIKKGMTRADLIKLFRIDGGLQPCLPTRYVLKSSNFIKVDVEFDVPQDMKSQIVPEDLRYEMGSPAVDLEGKPVPKEDYQFVLNEKLKIKNITRPYIEQFNYD